VSPAFLNFIETCLNGLMAGVMYSLVALGFVLIFKASGIFNFAQGVMALFAALTLVGFQTGQVPFSHLINAILGTEIHHWGGGMPTILAILLTMVVMVMLAYLLEKFVLKYLVNQEPIILFMATIGLAYFLEGLGDLMWGADIKPMDVGLPTGGSAVATLAAQFFLVWVFNKVPWFYNYSASGQINAPERFLFGQAVTGPNAEPWVNYLFCFVLLFVLAWMART
jgi:branched-subunit amino acid ABC-type transport system permease component